MILDGSSVHQAKFSWNIFTDVFDLRSLGSMRSFAQEKNSQQDA